MLKYRSKMAIITYGSTAVVLLVIGFLVGSMRATTSNACSDFACNRTLTAQTDHTAALSTAKVSTRKQIAGEYVLEERVTDAERAFETTMRSCLGAFCFDDAVRTSDGKDMIRVGIVAPDISDAKHVRKMMLAAGILLGDKLDLVVSSNVPPYGYGKNHGWSRIIRIARSVVPHSVSLLSSSSSSNTGSMETVDALIDSQVRQLMRWHCRLSHVAAHTAMLTVHTDQFLARPTTELEKMLTFAGYKPNRESLLAALNAHLPILQRVWDDAAVLTALATNSTMSRAQSVLDKAATAVNKEMAETQNLTKWPCRNFRDFRDKGVVKQLPLPVKVLAADCGAAYVKCSVRYDQDEYQRVMAQGA